METVGQLIDALGGPPAISGAAGVARNTVTYWERRGRIPPDYWDDLVRLARERTLAGVDHALLSRLCRPRKRRDETPDAPPAAQPQEAA